MVIDIPRCNLCGAFYKKGERDRHMRDCKVRQARSRETMHDFVTFIKDQNKNVIDRFKTGGDDDD